MPSSERRSLARQHFDAPEDVVFQAALETVRAIPGWEVITAHPERGQILARTRGRLFSPTIDHVLTLRRGEAGTDVDMESRSARAAAARIDPRSIEVFHDMMRERVAPQQKRTTTV